MRIVLFKTLQRKQFIRDMTREQFVRILAREGVLPKKLRLRPRLWSRGWRRVNHWLQGDEHRRRAAA